MKLLTTFENVCATFKAYNETNGISYGESKHAELKAYIVYKKCNFTLDYTEAERTYEISNQCGKKFFATPSGSQSMYGYSLDGSDWGVRLDKYDWEIDYCYYNTDDFIALENEQNDLVKVIRFLMKRKTGVDKNDFLINVIDLIFESDVLMKGVPLCENCEYAIFKDGNFDDCNLPEGHMRYCRDKLIQLVLSGVIK